MTLIVVFVNSCMDEARNIMMLLYRSDNQATLHVCMFFPEELYACDLNF